MQRGRHQNDSRVDGYLASDLRLQQQKRQRHSPVMTLLSRRRSPGTAGSTGPYGYTVTFELPPSSVLQVTNFEWIQPHTAAQHRTSCVITTQT